MGIRIANGAKSRVIGLCEKSFKDGPVVPILDSFSTKRHRQILLMLRLSFTVMEYIEAGSYPGSRFISRLFVENESVKPIGRIIKIFLVVRCIFLVDTATFSSFVDDEVVGQDVVVE